MKVIPQTKYYVNVVLPQTNISFGPFENFEAARAYSEQRPETTAVIPLKKPTFIMSLAEYRDTRDIQRCPVCFRNDSADVMDIGPGRIEYFCDHCGSTWAETTKVESFSLTHIGEADEN